MRVTDKVSSSCSSARSVQPNRYTALEDTCHVYASHSH